MKDFIKYTKTDLFHVKDSIGVPHPYCITNKHVVHASDNYGGMLGEGAIKSLEEKKGKPCCGVKGCNLYYHEHGQALLIAFKSSKTLEELKPELNDYLLSIKEMAEADNYIGFAFVQEV